MIATRRLAAIMAADIAGFSAAMEGDEEGTFALVQELRRKMIEPNIAEHQGRLIKTMGDGFLAEFGSPISATKCALAIQTELATAPLSLLASRPVRRSRARSRSLRRRKRGQTSSGCCQTPASVT